MLRTDVMSFARFAGEVLRYHTWPVIRRQSNGEHTWQVLRLYFQIWGTPSLEVMKYLIWHDCGEMRTGDLPFPVKARNPTLKEECDRLEQLQLASFGINLPQLTPEEKLRVKIVDLLEMWEFGTSETQLGNKFARCIATDTYAAATQLSWELPTADQDKLQAFLNKHPYVGVNL